MALPSIAPGTLFGPRWIVGRVLGKSELAVVYEAEEASQARFAALKMLEPALSRDAAAWKQFETITRSLAKLPSEGIAKSYDIGMMDSRPYVATERTTFPTLSRFVAERGALTPHAFSEALMTIARAVDAAHVAGITHGNLKPQNVFVSFDNAAWARVTDFGLAELREAARVPNPRTLGWNAPEVTPAPPTPASDLYSLGLLTFFALTGIPWFSAQRATTASGVPRPASASERARTFGGEIAVSLDAWFARALEREPEKRFASAIDLARAFIEAVDGPRPAPPSSSFPLSETIPVPEVNPAFQAAFKAAHAPTVAKPSFPPLDVTAPLPSRDKAPSASTVPLAQPSTAPPITARPSSAVRPPLAVVLIVVAALLVGALALTALVFAWLRLR